jgi:hypothetical protein
MNQQSLRALVVLLASIPLLGVLAGQRTIEAPHAPAIAHRSLVSDGPAKWSSSLTLDRFGEQAIVIPPVPPLPPEFYGMWFEDSPPTSFDDPPPRRTAIPDFGSLVDCDVAVSATDDIVIRPVPQQRRAVVERSGDYDILESYYR